MRVIFTPLAERQLDELHDYIAAHSNVQRADAFFGRIVTFCTGLATFPERGALRADLLAGLRIIGFERTTSIAFMVTGGAVLIEGIYHGGRSLEAVDWEAD